MTSFPIALPLLSLTSRAMATHFAKVLPRSESDTPADVFSISQALFAGLSVLIAVLALAVGFLQLKRYRARNTSRPSDLMYELEAGCSKVCPLS